MVSVPFIRSASRHHHSPSHFSRVSIAVSIKHHHTRQQRKPVASPFLAKVNNGQAGLERKATKNLPATSQAARFYSHA